MQVCIACDHANSDTARFCEHCATYLDVTVGVRKQRKIVTVVFCDVTGSTALGETTDPEALSAVLSRYFARMKTIVESHGGTGGALAGYGLAAQQAGGDMRRKTPSGQAARPAVVKAVGLSHG